MNIGIVTTWFERGAAYVSRQFMSTLSKEHEVFIYARGGEAYAKGDPVWDIENVTWGKKSALNIFTAIDLKDFRKWIESKKIDLVLFNEQFWMEPVLLCGELGVRTSAYIDYYTEETIPFFWCYDSLICNTKRHLSVFTKHPQVYYVPWGTDTDLFRNLSVEPVDKNTVVFFHSAGFSPHRKGTDLLIEAFSKINIPAKLIVHSQVDLVKLCPKLESIIYNLQRQQRLETIQKTVSAPGFYHLGDIYVYPSRLDGIGLTVVEALSCGLPVIATDNAPMNEFVNNSVGGLTKVDRFYARSDGYYWPQSLIQESHLIEQLTAFALLPVDDLKKFKKNAREYAQENLSWEKNSENLGKILEKTKLISQQDKKEYIGMVKDYQNRKLGKRVDLYLKYPNQYTFLHSLWNLSKKRFSTSPRN